MTNPQPSIAEMLILGHSNGLTTVDDAYMDYTRHVDLFFSMNNADEQMAELFKQTRARQLLGLTITEALEKMKIEIPETGEF